MARTEIRARDIMGEVVEDGMWCVLGGRRRLELSRQRYTEFRGSAVGIAVVCKSG